jgi:hypothetical protein
MRNASPVLSEIGQGDRAVVARLWPNGWQIQFPACFAVASSAFSTTARKSGRERSASRSLSAFSALMFP